VKVRDAGLQELIYSEPRQCSAKPCPSTSFPFISGTGCGRAPQLLDRPGRARADWAIPTKPRLLVPSAAPVDFPALLQFGGDKANNWNDIRPPIRY
jgi:hypothetical protein